MATEKQSKAAKRPRKADVDMVPTPSVPTTKTTVAAPASTTAAPKAEEETSQFLIVRNQVRTKVKSMDPGVHISAEFMVALNRHVEGALAGAQERCKANNRKTLKPCDI